MGIHSVCATSSSSDNLMFSLYFVFAGQVRIPKQLVVVGDAACILTSVAEAGLKLPLGVLYLLPHG